MNRAEGARAISRIARDFHGRGWALSTSGNYSALLSRKPFRLLVSASGINKKEFTPGHVVLVDERGKVVQGKHRPSDETSLHLAIIRSAGAGAVLHTHSVWGTVVSLRCAKKGKVRLQGFEILKALNRAYTHEERIEIPIVKNSQNYDFLSGVLARSLKGNLRCHGVLLEGHGLYTWGKNLEEALRNAETLEFLFEVTGRLHSCGGEGIP